jgi:hypothetical protein
MMTTDARLAALEAHVRHCFDTQTFPPEGPDLIYPEISWLESRGRGSSRTGRWFCYDTCFHEQVAAFKWTKQNGGYIMRNAERGDIVLFHAFIWSLAYGEAAVPRGRTGLVLDHVNADIDGVRFPHRKCDTRLANLRVSHRGAGAGGNARGNVITSPGDHLEWTTSGKIQVQFGWHNQCRSGAHGRQTYGSYVTVELATHVAVYVKMILAWVDANYPSRSFEDYHTWAKYVFAPFVKAFFYAVEKGEPTEPILQAYLNPLVQPSKLPLPSE